MGTDKHESELHVSDHHLWTHHRSAPSPEPVDIWADIGSDKSKQIGVSPLGTGDGHDELDTPFGADEESIDPAATVPGVYSSVPNLPPRMAAFERWAELPTSLSAHDNNHQMSSHTDLAEPPNPLALEERLETMRARNAEENYHDRIPPQDAPPHLQMMVLLYQWAAWALEVPHQKRREDLIRWVNGRFLEFMMAGGRVPGYNLKELLHIAGVDPKELYGCSDELVPQGRLIEDLSISKKAKTHSERQLNQIKKDAEVTATEKKGQGSHLESSALDAAGNDPVNMSPSVRSNGDDDEERRSRYDDRTDRSASTNDQSVSKLSDVSFPLADTAMDYEDPAAITNKRKRNAASVSRDTEQNSKRQETNKETVSKGVLENSDIPYSQTGNLDEVVARRKRYQQTIFKARLNLMLRNKKRSQYRKDLSNWSFIAKRLQRDGMSINTITALRDDFHNGWKTWDGSEFSELPESVQSSGQEEKAKPGFIFPTSTAASSKSTTVVQPHPNKAKPRSGKTVPEEHYDSQDDEWTAAKTSVRTRRQAAESATSPKGERHRGRPRKKIK